MKFHTRHKGFSISKTAILSELISRNQKLIPPQCKRALILEFKIQIRKNETYVFGRHVFLSVSNRCPVK